MNDNFTKKFGTDNIIKSIPKIAVHKYANAEKRWKWTEYHELDARVEQEKKSEGNNLIVHGMQQEKGDNHTRRSRRY